MHPDNLVVLRGHVSSEPKRRLLPSGTELVTIEVTTAAVDGSAASVPVAWFDPKRARVPTAGEQVVVVGHVRRRFFRAGGATASRTEVVAHRVVPAARRLQVERAVTEVEAALRPTTS